MRFNKLRTQDNVVVIVAGVCVWRQVTADADHEIVLNIWQPKAGREGESRDKEWTEKHR